MRVVSPNKTGRKVEYQTRSRCRNRPTPLPSPVVERTEPTNLSMEEAHLDPISNYERLVLGILKNTQGLTSFSVLHTQFLYKMGVDGSRARGVDDLLRRQLSQLEPKKYIRIDNTGGAIHYQITPRGLLVLDT